MNRLGPKMPPAFPVYVPTKTVRTYYRSRRYSKLLVLDKDNGGKADALNAALNAARYPYVLAVDADTLIESDALLRLARPFLMNGLLLSKERFGVFHRVRTASVSVL